jgi:uncharacterized protein (TIGR03067 family)
MAPPPDELAKHFPQLEIIGLLGQGGMGAVYKAREPGLDRLVALKILPPDAARDPAFAERFKREARALAKLNHPNIVAVYGLGEADGLYYFIMEYVDGVNLRELIFSGQCKPEEALKIVPQICEALQFAHDEGIVHRDIKPENILLDKRGRLKIADFGLARLFRAAAGSPATPRDYTLTGPWQVMGTPNYMAPEQVDDPLHVDHRADIYALGVVFYEMLTGELPRGRFAPPSQKVEVDVRLDEVVLRALEQEPERRYQQASEVKTDVETISRSPLPGKVGQVIAAHQSPEQLGVAGHENLAHPMSYQRFSGFAIVGAVWALFGLLTILPTLYFIGLNRVWNGTAKPTDVIYEEPPLVFTLFMGALLAIGAGAPIGTTILGALSIQHIKRSGGRIVGLPLAVADVIIFPLLILGGVVGTLSHGVQAAIWANEHTGYVYKEGILVEVIAPDPATRPDMIFLILDVLIAQFVWFFAGRAAWRAIAGGVAGVESASTQSPQPSDVAATGSPTLPARDNVQAPADAMMLVAGAAILTAIGVAIWLSSQWNAGLAANTRFTLIGMSLTQAVYGLFMIAGGLLMRRLRVRTVVLFCVVIAGLFVPAVVALNVVMEFSHITQWPVVIPMWLGVPVALWATIVLFRRDVRAAFTAQVRTRRPARRAVVVGTVFGLVCLIVGVVTMPSMLRRGAASPTAQWSFTVAGPHIEVSLNGQKAQVSADGLATVRLRPGDYETAILKGNSLQWRVYEFAHAGDVKHTDERDADTIWIKGPLTLEFEPTTGNPAVADYTAIQGMWSVVAQVKDGSFLLEQQRGEWIEFEKNIMRSDLPKTLPYQPFLTEARFAIESSTSPRQFEILDIGAKGIYRLDGDTLTLAVASAGQPRPTEFVSWSGRGGTATPAGVTLTLCRRANATTGSGTGGQRTMPKTGERWFGNKGAEKVMFWGPASPTVSDQLAGHLGLDPSQREAMNHAFQMFFREFIALEEQNTRHETDANGHQITTIAPHRQHLPPLVERFWSELDSILDGRQLTQGREVLYLSGGMFELVEYGYRVEIWRVGQINPWYHWKESYPGISSAPPADDRPSSGPELPERLRRFWKEPRTDDAATLQGTWVAVAGERNGGQPLSAEEAGGVRLTFERDQMRVAMQGRNDEGTFKLDGSQRPRRVAVTRVEGPNRFGIMDGIYELDGDHLRLCMGEPEERPTEFKTKVGSRLIALDLVRQTAVGPIAFESVTGSLIQTGTLVIDRLGKFDVTYPRPFAGAPTFIFPREQFTGPGRFAVQQSTATGFTIEVSDAAFTREQPVRLGWLTIGSVPTSGDTGSANDTPTKTEADSK